MATNTYPIHVFLETGKTRSFAIILGWPGWCRSGRDEESALQQLIEYGPRYAGALADTHLGFCAPSGISDLLVVERLPGSVTTDFGAPAAILPTDALPVDAEELTRLQTVIKASWKTFDRIAVSASGKTLRKGPRGGGRDLERIVEHLQEAEAAYHSSLGGKTPRNAEWGTDQALKDPRQAILATLTLAVRGEIPAHGPRGGLRWTPRFFVRRLVWHVLDHAWEIEDRAE